MKSQYVIWGFVEVDNALAPRKLEGASALQKMQLWTGHKFADDAPSGLQFTANPDYPDDLKLIDYFGNSESVFPVSPKLQAFLENEALPNLQFIPVDMLDHRGRALATYHLMHVTNPIDCINVAKSTVTENRLQKGMFNTVRKLVLDETKVPAEARLFKIARLYRAIAVHRDLAKALTGAKFTGLAWREVAQYTV